MIFTSESGKNLTSLVKAIDKHIGKNQKSQKRAFVNIIGGESRSKLQKAAKTASKGTKNIPFVVPVEFENGPANFGINPKAGLTLMLYKGGRVRQNFAIPKGKLDKKAVAKLVKASAKFFGVKEKKKVKKDK